MHKTSRRRCIWPAGVFTHIRRRTDRHPGGAEHALRHLSTHRQASLEAVPGVSKVDVSYKDKTAMVIYDDVRTDVAALTRATTNAGYPSAPRD